MLRIVLILSHSYIHLFVLNAVISIPLIPTCVFLMSAFSVIRNETASSRNTNHPKNKSNLKIKHYGRPSQFLRKFYK